MFKQISRINNQQDNSTFFDQSNQILIQLKNQKPNSRSQQIPKDTIITCNHQNISNQFNSCIDCGFVLETNIMIDQRKFTFKRQLQIDKQVRDSLQYQEFQQKCKKLRDQVRLKYLEKNELYCNNFQVIFDNIENILQITFDYMAIVLEVSQIKGDKLFKLYLYIISIIIGETYKQKHKNEYLAQCLGLTLLDNYNIKWYQSGRKLHQQYEYANKQNLLKQPNINNYFQNNLQKPSILNSNCSLKPQSIKENDTTNFIDEIQRYIKKTHNSVDIYNQYLMLEIQSDDISELKQNQYNNRFNIKDFVVYIAYFQSQYWQLSGHTVYMQCKIILLASYYLANESVLDFQKIKIYQLSESSASFYNSNIESLKDLVQGILNIIDNLPLSITSKHKNKQNNTLYEQDFSTFCYFQSIQPKIIIQYCQFIINSVQLQIT